MTDKNIQKWTILEEQDVSPSHWFPITKQKVKLANNNVYDYYFSELGDVVQVLAITKQNEVVLELPGGMQQKDTSLTQSALNELEEETGIKTTAEQLISLGKIAINPTKLKQVTYGFIMFNAEFNSVQQLEDTEDIQIVLKPAPEVLKLALNGGIWVTDSVSFILRAAMMYPDVFRVTEGIENRDL